MPTPWFRRFRKEGQLTVCNRGGSWTAAVNTSINTFNGLGFGVRLVPTNDERNANIVVKLSNGSETYPHPSKRITTSFDATELHGRAHTLADGRRGLEIFFAIAFLPGKVANPTPGQMEVVIVHELIHCAGLNGENADGTKAPNDDHDSIGIMYPQMIRDGGGLIEHLHDKEAKPMPKIRVGSKTMSKMRALWTRA
ncbi:MAG: hypothetical protein AB7F88_10485 [Pyrinomonadaceae bacterium]